MNKLKYLQENHQDDLMLLVENLYKQKYQKKKKEKTICHFRALGNDYNNDIFVRNYESFMNHVTLIKPFNQVKEVMYKYLAEDKSQFSDKCNKKNQALKLDTGYFLNTYSTTEVKVGHIKKICQELLKCELKFI